MFGLSTWLPLSLAALFVTAPPTVSAVIRFSLVQPRPTTCATRRVNALFIGTSNQLGEFEPAVAALLGRWRRSTAVAARSRWR